jgi:hypothetical protein
MILTEEQRYLQKNKFTYRRTMIQKKEIITEEQRFHRITTICTKEHPPDRRFICSTVHLPMAIILNAITQ